MLINIPFPSKCISRKDKQDFVEDLIKWGNENLNDQENWKYKVMWLRSNRFCVNDNCTVIRFEMNDETDGMALILAWSEN